MVKFKPTDRVILLEHGPNTPNSKIWTEERNLKIGSQYTVTECIDGLDHTKFIRLKMRGIPTWFNAKLFRNDKATNK